jgi:carbon storage regulator
MLLLTRYPNQGIIIGQMGDIRISILSIKKNQVQLGISAPKSLPVHREEIFYKIQREELEKRKIAESY